VATNFWLELEIDAYLRACAEGRDWEEAVAEARRVSSNAPLRVLTREDLKRKKGIPYSRQHISRKVRNRTFPRPFQAPV
jgi:hypothetical protein